MSSGYVYLFDLGFDNLFKIGKADDFNRRYRAFLAANSKLTICHASLVDEPLKVEDELKCLLASYCFDDREIFKLDDEILKLVINWLEGKEQPLIERISDARRELVDQSRRFISERSKNNAKHGESTSSLKRSDADHVRQMGLAGRNARRAKNLPRPPRRQNRLLAKLKHRRLSGE